MEHYIKHIHMSTERKLFPNTSDWYIFGQINSIIQRVKADYNLLSTEVSNPSSYQDSDKLLIIQ